MQEVTHEEALREVPYVVRDREPELRSLVGAVAAAPSVLRLIIGPPCSGKTTLLSYLENWAEQNGMHVVRIRGEDFNGDEALATANNLESDRGKLMRGRGPTRRVRTWVGWRSGTLGNDAGPYPVRDIRKVVAAAARRGQRGVLLTIDEVDSMIDDLHPSATRRLRILLRLMQSGIVKPQAGGWLPRAILVATGSLTAIEELQQTLDLDIESRQAVRLGPVGPRTANRIVEDHWEYGKPRMIDVLPRPPAEWLARIIGGCEGSVHQVQDLALRTARQAVRGAERGDRAFGGIDLEHIESDLLQSRKRIHGNRRINAGCEGRGPNAITATVLAQASRIWDNRIPDWAVYDLATATVAGFNDGPREELRAQALRALQRNGIIEYCALSLEFKSVCMRKGDRPYWTVPTRSFATHVSEMYGGRLPDGMDVHSPQVQRWLNPDEATRREHWVPPWEWRDS